MPSLPPLLRRNQVQKQEPCLVFKHLTIQKTKKDLLFSSVTSSDSSRIPTPIEKQ